jgi:CheY-like chemotaxis protein
MDGYETMEAIRKEDLPCLVIVVSGDVQAQARERMLALGAIDFIRKPIDNEKLTNILSSYGIYSGVSTAVQREAVARDTDASSLEDKLDAYREMVNIAMGRAGESLAQLMGEFVDLPIPNVNLLESNELSMAIATTVCRQYRKVLSVREFAVKRWLFSMILTHKTLLSY